MQKIYGTFGNAPSSSDRIAWPSPLALRIGQTETVRVIAHYPNGVPVALAGHTVVLTVRDNTAANFTRLSVTGTLQPSDGPNVVDFAISASATANIPPGRYVFDVWITVGTLSKTPLTPVLAVFFSPAATF
jgi:hypothetical protein